MRKQILKRIISEFAEGDLFQPNSVSKEMIELFPDESASRRLSWEKRQVPASDSKGLGFGWIEVSKGEKHGLRLQPEGRVAVWNLSAYEKVDARLGYAEFLGKAAAYGKDKRTRSVMGRAIESFWEWLAS